jgi:TPR repeat
VICSTYGTRQQDDGGVWYGALTVALILFLALPCVWAKYPDDEKLVPTPISGGPSGSDQTPTPISGDPSVGNQTPTPTPFISPEQDIIRFINSSIGGRRKRKLANRYPPKVERATSELIRRGNRLFRQGKKEKAIKTYREAITVSPHDHETYHRLGVVLYQLNYYEAADLAFGRTLKLKEGYTPAINMLRKNEKRRLEAAQLIAAATRTSATATLSPATGANSMIVRATRTARAEPPSPMDFDITPPQWLPRWLFSLLPRTIQMRIGITSIDGIPYPRPPLDPIYYVLIVGWLVLWILVVGIMGQKMNHGRWGYAYGLCFNVFGAVLVFFSPGTSKTIVSTILGIIFLLMISSLIS